MYINWLLPWAALATYIPPPLRLQRAGPAGAFGVLSIVAFQHGHFGPAALGPLRRLAPSPVQSNWRTYVDDPTTGRKGVYFLTTTISNPLYAIAARLTADNVPMWCPRRNLVRSEGGRVDLVLEGGRRGCPEIEGHWRETGGIGPVDPPGPRPWSHGFSSFREMLDFVVPQDRAMAVRDGHVVRIELDLSIPLDRIRHLAGTLRPGSASDIAGDAESWCFLAPSVGLAQNRQRGDSGGPQSLGVRE